VIDEQGQKLAENIPDDEDQAEDKDREQEADNQFAADETVDQFHSIVSLIRKGGSDKR
jgi:hypothetical protein